VVIGDDAGHQEHEQRARGTGERGTGQRDRPRVPDAQDRDADRGGAAGEPERAGAPDSSHRGQRERADHEQEDPEPTAVQGRDHAGQTELLAQLAQHDPH
jgi:hypothetical protein